MREQLEEEPPLVGRRGEHGRELHPRLGHDLDLFLGRVGAAVHAHAECRVRAQGAVLDRGGEHRLKRHEVLHHARGREPLRLERLDEPA